MSVSSGETEGTMQPTTTYLKASDEWVAHDTHLTHERAADIARHNAALHFTRNLKGPFWYWFAVDMLLSVLAIGGLGTVQAWPDVQVLLALVVVIAALAGAQQFLALGVSQRQAILEWISVTARQQPEGLVELHW